MSDNEMSRDEMDWIDHLWSEVSSAGDADREKAVIDKYHAEIRKRNNLNTHSDYMGCLRGALKECGEWYEPESAIDRGAQEYYEIMLLQEPNVQD